MTSEHSKFLLKTYEEYLNTIDNSHEMQYLPYEFDFLLRCNKICGASHYNMQMKIIVETEKEFEEWMSSQQTFAQVIQ